MQSLKSRPVSYPLVDSAAGALIFKQFVFVKHDAYVLSTDKEMKGVLGKDISSIVQQVVCLALK